MASSFESPTRRRLDFSAGVTVQFATGLCGPPLSPSTETSAVCAVQLLPLSYVMLRCVEFMCSSAVLVTQLVSSADNDCIRKSE